MKGRRATLNKIIEPVVTSLGYELVGCVYIPRGRYATLRVYIDKPEGITLDDCQRVSRQVSAVLDVEDPITQQYELEISSPGLDRPLFSEEHYHRFVGSKIRLRLYSPTEGRRKLTGTLQAVNEENIIIKTDDNEMIVPFEDIDQANLVPDFD